jgi:hypothetical protein
LIRRASQIKLALRVAMSSLRSRGYHRSAKAEIKAAVADAGSYGTYATVYG